MTATAQDFTEINHFPTLVGRIKAFFIDFLFILLVFTLTSYIIGLVGGAPTSIKVTIFVFFILLYDPIMISQFGGTIGHMFIGLQVKKYGEESQNISFLSALFRITVKALLGWLSFISVSFNPQKRAIHDMTSRSIVIFKS